jgi:hypothetical protein
MQRRHHGYGEESFETPGNDVSGNAKISIFATTGALQTP